MTDTLTDIVERYYAYRYPNGRPDARQALLWMLSEIGELVDAWLAPNLHSLNPADMILLQRVIECGQVAETLVSMEREWIRNQDRRKAANVRFEIGDTLMMLTRFAIEAGAGDPQTCMTDKMKTKGFEYDA